MTHLYFLCTGLDAIPSVQDTVEPNGPLQGQIETSQGPKIEVPRIDDQFDSFFSTADKIITSHESEEIKDIDLDVAVIRSSEL